ncbi:MAG: cob(I)yrinic acid a,c-diamide adenosyltransferase [Rhodothermales bacterium]
MKIYTRTGDQGTTALFGGDRVSKTDARIAAYGTVDETNSYIGLARSLAADQPGFDRLDAHLSTIQNDLFILGADLATPYEARAKTARVGDEHVARLEESIDSLQDELPELKQFILPGGTPTSSVLHVARTVCRRAERLVIAAAESENISPAATIYLNRLSDYLFVLARWANRVQGGTEHRWQGTT